MEYPYWLDKCEHGTRLEYCNKELLDDDSDIAVVTGKLETIVESVRQGSVEFSCTTDSDILAMKRGFQYDFPASSEHDIFGTRESVEIEIENHKTPERRVYSVVSSWRLAGADFLSSTIKRMYTIEIYPGGGSQYTVTEMDIQADEAQTDESVHYVDRPMLGYDATELAKLLQRVHDVELADRDYIDPESYIGWTQSV